jgi:hypothetical protein
MLLWMVRQSASVKLQWLPWAKLLKALGKLVYHMFETLEILEVFGLQQTDNRQLPLEQSFQISVWRSHWISNGYIITTTVSTADMSAVII